MTTSLPIVSVSARERFADDDRCRFRPSTKAGLRVVCRLTARCHLRCEHCLASAAGNLRSEDLPLEDWKAILNEFSEIGAHKVLLTGGEPMLFEGLVELTSHVAEMGISTDLNSTLWFMTPEKAAELVDAGLTEASISIEGPEDVHDAMHGRPGARRRLRDGVRMLQEAGIVVDGSLCVTPENLLHVESTIREAAEWGLGSFTVSRMLPVGHGLKYVGPSVSDQQLRQLHATLSELPAERYGISVRCVALLGPPRAEDCLQGQSLIGIRADGSLTSCVLTRDELPDLPHPRSAGLVQSVREMRRRLERIQPRFCFGDPS